MSYVTHSHIDFADSHSVDAFGRLRTCHPQSVFSTTHQCDTSPVWWLDTITAATTTPTITHLPNESSVRLRILSGATVGAIAQRQTRQYFRYQPGKSQDIVMSCVPVVGATTNVKRQVGLFDTNNGVFFQHSGTAVAFVRRSYVTGSAVEETVAQADWNIDQFDGTGPSGFTLDFTKAQLLHIDLQWLGTGRVRMGWIVNGINYIAHEFDHANIITSVYMTTATLPLTYRIEATGTTTSDADLIQICSAVASEGGTDLDLAYQFSSGNGATGITVNTTQVTLVALRVDPNCPAGGSVANALTAYLTGMSVFVSTAHNIYWQLYYGATLDNTGWADVNGTYSGIQISTTCTASAAAIQIASGYVPSSGSSKVAFDKSFQLKFPLMRNGLGTVNSVTPVGNLWLAARNLAAANATVYSVLDWIEQY